ncbi:MAG TPA: hypothetical protein VMZ31_10230 [Phycisphaerae bacterium]|nr:hypothetical protein [Phycisphaerae bacterium]
MRRVRADRLGLMVGVVIAVFGGCGPAVLSVSDAIVSPGEPVRLTAFVYRDTIRGVGRDIEGVQVRFRVDGSPARSARTDDDGWTSVQWALPSGGASRFEATALVDGRTTQAGGAIYTWDKERIILAVDVDGTLAQTDYDDLILGRRDAGSQPLPDAQQTLDQLSADFHILYLTARPQYYVEKTRRWLKDCGFPTGPVFTAPRLRDTIRHTRFKRRMLATLRKDWPNLLIGIGNKAADAEAYGASGMLSLIVRRVPDKDLGPHAIMLADWPAVSRFFDANAEVLHDPRELTRATRGEIMLLRPVVAWQEKD